MSAYYNELDPYAAQWLRNLITAGHIAPGYVDERSIVDVRPGDLDGYEQCHFFAGIGGWSHALRLAGIDDGFPIWTGSCPCQPLSVSGQRKGHLDERHLWPAFFGLITERSPSMVFGEQVASKDGREWLAGVRLDLEAMGYACGASDLCAAGIGAPHIRQRIYWVADTQGTRGRGRQAVAPLGSETTRGPGQDICAEPWPDGRHCSSSLAVADVLSPSHGIPARVGRLRAYGNAIVPQVAAAFVESFMQAQLEAA